MEQKEMEAQFAKLQTGQERWEVYNNCLDRLANVSTPLYKKDLTR